MYVAFTVNCLIKYFRYVDPKLSFSEIIVPTNDSVRNTYLLDTLLSNDKHVLMVGATGAIYLSSHNMYNT